MIVIQVARLIANISLFSDYIGEDDADPDAVVQLLETLGGALSELDDEEFLRELIDAFPLIAPEYSGTARQLVLNLPFYLNLEETLAAGDPVRLAELEASWDSRSAAADIEEMGEVILPAMPVMARPVQDGAVDRRDAAGRRAAFERIADYIISFVAFLKLNDAEIVRPDVAAEALARVGADLRAIDQPFRSELVDAFAVAVLDFAEEDRPVLRAVPRDFGLAAAAD